MASGSKINRKKIFCEVKISIKMDYYLYKCRVGHSVRYTVEVAVVLNIQTPGKNSNFHIFSFSTGLETTAQNLTYTFKFRKLPINRLKLLTLDVFSFHIS